MRVFGLGDGEWLGDGDSAEEVVRIGLGVKRGTIMYSVGDGGYRKGRGMCVCL